MLQSRPPLLHWGICDLLLLYHQILSRVVDGHLDFQGSCCEVPSSFSSACRFLNWDPSFGKCANRLCVSFLLEGRGSGRSVSRGCSRSLPDDFEFVSTKPSVNSSDHSGGMSRHRSPDAVCRTGSPDAELLLVSAESSADTEIT